MQMLAPRRRSRRLALVVPFLVAGMLLVLVLCALLPARPTASAENVTLTALFMKQAAYSDADVRAIARCAHRELKHRGAATKRGVTKT